jgi:hypothetical protein
LRRTKPIDTALTAAVPISVNTTRRERFMGLPSVGEAMELLSHFRQKGASANGVVWCSMADINEANKRFLHADIRTSSQAEVSDPLNDTA